MRTLTIAVSIAAALALGACGPVAGPAAGPLPAASVALPSPPVAIPGGYRDAALRSVAARLHTTVAALRSGLATTPAATLMTLAKPLGFAQDQLAATVRAGLTDATGAEVGSGSWTAMQAAQVSAFWRSIPDDALIAQVSQWCRGSA
jgi:hypothetical protein